MRVRKQKDNFRLSVIEILSDDSEAMESVKKQLLRSLLRTSGKRKVDARRRSYFSILRYLDAIGKELRIEEANDLVERLQERNGDVYERDIYSFVLRHFHELKDVNVTWRLLGNLQMK